MEAAVDVEGGDGREVRLGQAAAHELRRRALGPVEAGGIGEGLVEEKEEPAASGRGVPDGVLILLGRRVDVSERYDFGTLAVLVQLEVRR